MADENKAFDPNKSFDVVEEAQSDTPQFDPNKSFASEGEVPVVKKKEDSAFQSGDGEFPFDPFTPFTEESATTAVKQPIIPKEFEEVPEEDEIVPIKKIPVMTEQDFARTKTILREFDEAEQAKFAKPEKRELTEEEKTEQKQFFDQQATRGALLGAPALPDKAANAINNTMQTFLTAFSGLPKSIAILSKWTATKLGDEDYKDRDVTSLATYKLGEWMATTAKEMFPTNPEWQDEFVSQFASGIGFVGSMAVGGLGAKGLKISTKALASMSPKIVARKLPKTIAVTPGGATVLASTSQAADEFKNAKISGLNDEEAFEVFTRNLVIGASESLPFARAMTRINKVSKGGVSKWIGGLDKNHPLVKGTIGGVEEMVQEIGQTIATNWVAGDTYDKTRELLAGVEDAATVGFMIGALLGGIGGAVNRKLKEPGLTEEQIADLENTRDQIEKEISELEGREDEFITPDDTDPEIVDLQKQKTALEKDLVTNDKINKEGRAAIREQISNIDDEITDKRDTAQQNSLDEFREERDKKNIEELKKALKDKNLTDASKEAMDEQINSLETKKEEDATRKREIEEGRKPEHIEAKKGEVPTEAGRGDRDVEGRIIEEKETTLEYGKDEQGFFKTVDGEKTRITEETFKLETERLGIPEEGGTVIATEGTGGEGTVLKEEVAEEVKPTKEERVEKANIKISQGIDDLANILGATKFVVGENPMNKPDVFKAVSNIAEGILERGVISAEDFIVKLKEALKGHIEPEHIDEFADKLSEGKTFEVKVEKPSEVKKPVEKKVEKKVEEERGVGTPKQKEEKIKKIVAEDEKIDKKEPVEPVIHKTKAQAKKATDFSGKEKTKRINDTTGFTLNDETWRDKFVTEIQDKYDRINQLQKSLGKADVSITDKLDVYMQVELMVGKTKEIIDKKESEIVRSKPKQEKSLLERMKDDKIDLNEYALYPYAKHAPERNQSVQAERTEIAEKQIAKLTKERDIAKKEGIDAQVKYLDRLIDDIQNNKNPDFEIIEDGSGMSNEQAAEILEAIEKDGKTELYEKYRKEFSDKVIMANQKALVDYDLETAETMEALNKKYKYYVPLRVAELEKEKGAGGGKGLSVRGRNIYKAKGSNFYGAEERVNPIIQALSNYNETVIKGEKNLVDKTFLDLVRNNPNPKVWKIVDAEKKGEGDVLPLSENGKPVFIKIKDKALAKAMLNLGATRAIPLIHSMNNYLRAVNTMLNPEFVITNFERDIQTALINISATEQKGIKRKLLKNIAPAMKGIWQSEMGVTGTKWADIANDLKEQGGKVGWLDLQNVEDKANDVVKSLDLYNSDKTRDKLEQAWNTVGEYIERVNTTVEMASRTAAYQAALDSGISKAKAAQLAKNLTVNFNKKGNLGVMINSLYLFANAGIQGSTIIFKSLKSAKVRKITAGIAAGSFALNMLNAYINEEEWDKIPDNIKSRNLIIMMPNGNYSKIALPYGYNIFKVMGDITYDVWKGKKDAGEVVSALLTAVDDAFNPVSSGTFAQTVSPTFFDPLIQWLENKNWFGGPIRPEQPVFRPEVPENTLYFSGTKQWKVDVAKWLNDISGGTAAEKGELDISPELIDHYTDFVGGGLGSFIGNTIGTGVTVAKGEMPETRNIPFYRKFVGGPHEYRDVKIAYDMVKKSWTKEFTDKQKDIFGISLRNAKAEGLIDKKKFNKLKKEFERGQKIIRLSRDFPSLSIDELKDKVK